MLKDLLKRIYYSLVKPSKVVLLDYPVDLVTTGKAPNEKLFGIISANNTSYSMLLNKALSYKDAFASIKQDSQKDEESLPGWNNGFLPGLDMIMLYTLIAETRPKKYLEIGSGSSTKVVNQCRQDNKLSVEITSIDPQPRQTIVKIADKIFQHGLENADLSVFGTLQENDILFFDGTHVLAPNSDVTVFFLKVLPMLKAGVLVHVHDIYIPYEYPAFMQKRFYNEQYILAATLLSNPARYEVVAPNYYIYQQKELHGILSPVWQLPSLQNVEQHGGSFWFRVKQ